MDLARQGRQTLAAVRAAADGAQPGSGQYNAITNGMEQNEGEEEPIGGTYTVAPPPGTDKVQYASLAGE